MLDLAHPVAKVFQHHGQTMTVSAPAESQDASLWIPPIVRTIATEGTGVAGLVESIRAHAEHLRQSGDWARREKARLESELDLMLTETLIAQFRAGLPESRYDEVVDRLTKRTLSPWEAVKSLMNGKKP
jgi:LAO/AO transport system kinase